MQLARSIHDNTWKKASFFIMNSHTSTMAQSLGLVGYYSQKRM
jgi:hypothetical protein